MEMQYSKRESTSHLDGNPGSFGTVAYPAGSRVPASNPNNPTGEDGSLFFRPSSTIGPRTSEHESNTIRFVTGVEGAIPENLWFNDEWSYEASFLYTKVDADLRTNSTWNLARFIRISDPAQCSVDDLCSSTVNASGALDSLRPGNWTQEEISYMRQNTLAISKFSTHGWSAVISGPLFEMPAGEVAMAAGLEYRKERGLNVPDPTTEAGESVANQVFTTEGSYGVEEFFVEFDIPLLADVFLAEDLTLNLQWRQSDYSTYGKDDVYRVGLNWQVVDSVRLRANVSTAYRAPSITDLFGGGTVSFDPIDDPCQGAVAGSNEAQNCALDGLGAGFTQVTSQYPVLAGSNPNLEPETADTWTAGIVYTPGYLPGLQVSIDVWDIEVESLINRPTSTSVLEDCYGGPVGKTAAECSQFQGRNPQGVPINFVNRLSNEADGVQTDGFDMAINYGFDAFADTTWNVELVGTYTAENTFYPGAGGADDAGSIPRVVANLNTNVDWNNWGFGWYMRYVSAMNDPRYDGTDNTFGYSGTDKYYKHDLRGSYDWDNYRILVGVNNVTDEDPEYVFSSGNNTDTNLYDVRGAYYFVRFEAQLL
jgi:iron complex outermembrane receptor protein